MYPRAPSFMPGKCRTGHDLFTYLPMTQRGKSFLPDTFEALANLHASMFRWPRTPLKPRTLPRSSLRRIEPTRKILGYLQVPRTAGTSKTFEVLANFASFGTCAATKKKLQDPRILSSSSNSRNLEHFRGVCKVSTLRNL